MHFGTRTMKKQLISLSIAIAAGLMASGAAQAASYQGVVAGTGAAEDFSTDGLIGIYLESFALGATTLRYTIGAADLSSLSFNAVLGNQTGEGLTGYLISLSSGSFLPGGTVTRQFAGSAVIDLQGGNAAIHFSTPEYLDVDIGDPRLEGEGKIDWLLSGLSAGDTLDITVTAVPEPQTYAMLLAGLGALLATRRRRASQRS